MSRGLQSPAARAWDHLVNRSPMDCQKANMVKRIVSLGCMPSSAVASPMLYEFRAIWVVDLIVFLSSSAIYTLDYQEEIKLYGPYTLATITLLGLLAFSSARDPLGDLVPWIPFSISVCFLLTVFFAPRVHEFFTPQEDLTTRMEEGQIRAGARSLVEPGSVQYDEDTEFQTAVVIPFENRSHDLSYMGPSSLSSGESSSDSSISLGGPKRLDILASLRTVRQARRNDFARNNEVESTDALTGQVVLPGLGSPELLHLSDAFSPFRDDEGRQLS